MDGDRSSFNAFMEFLSTPLSDAQPFVLETKQALSLHFDHLSTQSFMSLDEPDRLVLGYTRAMMGFLLLQPRPRHICMVGLGGGSMAKYCHARLPGTAVTAVEINPEVIALRDVFRIPVDDARFEVVQADGAEHMRVAAARSDVILLDAFVAQGMPAQCASAAFFAACRERLADAGVLVVNLADCDPALPEHVERLRSAFGTSYALFAVRDSGNYVAFAWKGAHRLPAGQALLERARALGDAHPLELASTARSLKRGERFDPARFVRHANAPLRWRIAA
ncbi:fused MFS/spermidine synthase [Burkholderia sp. lig30]|uniref:fused MFS/spermidine synthase n=1 Tax=Burkholderia sp. lig30 TaxID=1192124 RepID=UPI00128F6912|nr:fused MFS/spermidine synthase [Burkholderia sp. lig30]